MTQASRDNSSLEVTPTEIPSACMCSMSAVDLALGGEEHRILLLGCLLSYFEMVLHSILCSGAQPVVGWSSLSSCVGWAPHFLRTCPLFLKG